MARRGRKDCPNCNTEVGARSYLCDCGYHFPSGEIRKDLLKVKVTPTGPKVYKELGKGRKKCPSCNIIIAGIVKNCHKCNFDFISAKKEKDEIKDKIREEKKIIREGKIKKREEDREDKRKKKDIKVEEKISPIVQELMKLPKYVAPIKFSPEDHAKRILGYGVRRAKILLSLAQKQRYWNHVDWGMVEQGLVRM